MTFSSLPDRPFIRGCFFLLRMGFTLMMLPLAGLAKTAWKTVPTEELAEAKPKVDAEAPAEALVWNIEVDDREFPYERTVTEYIRYKIFDPSKVDSITRVSSVDFSESDNRNELSARLTLPNGQTREFGKESLKEQSLAKQAQTKGFFSWLGGSGPELVEKFLAVTGVESGAVLEFQIKRTLKRPAGVQAFFGQRENVPTRQLNFTCRTLRDDYSYNHRIFVFNKQSAVMKQDAKARLISVTATNLPAVVTEPVMGPMTDYALTIMSCYDSRQLLLLPRSGKVPIPDEVPDKLGPWTFYSTIIHWLERDRGWQTKRVKQLAADLTAGLADDAARARKVHDHVRMMAQKWYKHPPPTGDRRRAPNSLDEVIDWEKEPEVMVNDDDFLWLAVALSQAAGLESHVMLLPNRKLSRFYRENASPVFLPFMALAVRLGGEWKLASPQSRYPLPFGLVPWEQEGQLGLLALPRKEEFVSVPPTPSDKTVIGGLGVFEIDAEGALSGNCRRTFTGHSAALVRSQLYGTTDERRDEIIKEKFGFDTKLVDLTLGKIEGLDDADRPVEFNATLRWPGFAVRTKDRLVLRVSLFHTDGASPFTATERRHPVHFPHRWQENERFAIRLPEGFGPEGLTVPPTMPGEVLSYRLMLGYEEEKNLLHVQRTFVSNVLEVAPLGYEGFKKWHAIRSRADQHEVVFVRQAAGKKPKAEAPAK